MSRGINGDWNTLPKTNSSLAGKSTILMVFTRKHGDFHGRTVSFREGKWLEISPTKKMGGIVGL